VRILLDTHTFLWFVSGDARTSQTAQALIQDPNNDKCVSIASAWEIAIKVSKGKLNLAAPVEVLFQTEIQQRAFTLLGLEWAHVGQVATLPWHHRDPFDRLLIAQALVEQLSIVGIDPAFDAYPITRLW